MNAAAREKKELEARFAKEQEEVAAKHRQELERRDSPPIVRRLTIMGTHKHGLPTSLDDEVLVGLRREQRAVGKVLRIDAG